jgi:hypothetical protein
MMGMPMMGMNMGNAMLGGMFGNVGNDNQGQEQPQQQQQQQQQQQ